MLNGKAFGGDERLKSWDLVQRSFNFPGTENSGVISPVFPTFFFPFPFPI